jgi:hypothetical protein
MRDVVGAGADKRDAVLRPSESIEHPQSGQPLHDLTGGNVWVPTVLASAVTGSPNYDATNDSLLNQGPAVLTLDLTQGEGIDPNALLAGADRARQQLLLAATIKNVAYNGATGALSFQVQNNSGHKLISGFPEGRRMFVNIRAYAGGGLIYEANPYDPVAGTLKGLTYPYLGQGLPDPQPLGTSEAYVDELVYEMKPSSNDLTGEAKTFHFALATGRYKDNRIPPRGFDIGGAPERVAVPVWHGVEDPNLFTSAEYSGGYDEVSLTIPAGADSVVVSLYYQTTSREYIEFLRDEINGTGNLTLSSPTPSGETNAYRRRGALPDGQRHVRDPTAGLHRAHTDPRHGDPREHGGGPGLERRVGRPISRRLPGLSRPGRQGAAGDRHHRSGNHQLYRNGSYQRPGVLLQGHDLLRRDLRVRFQQHPLRDPDHRRPDDRPGWRVGDGNRHLRRQRKNEDVYAAVDIQCRRRRGHPRRSA